MTDSPTDASVNTTSSHVFHRSLVNEPLLAVRAEGNYIYLKYGRKLLDGSGGAAVTNIGHGDKRVIAGILDQLQTVDYVHSGTFSNKTAEELAIELTKDSGMARAIFVSGGSEAIESAIKLARQYHLENKQSERINFIARQQSYHGNTLGALGLCRHTARRAPFLPYFSSHFHHVSPCFAYHYKLDNESDEDYVNRLADELEAKFQELGPHTVAAFFAETIVGATSGCTPAVPGYFKAMRNVCDRHGALFVLDEIMCGIGRTGKMHAWQWEDLSSPPDIQVLGKGLGGGYASIATILISTKVINAFLAGSGSFTNGFTYQSHAVGCRAALEVLKIIKQDQLIEQCYQRGIFLQKILNEQLSNHLHVGDIRGRGLFWSVEFVKNKETKEMYPSTCSFIDSVIKECIERGVVIYPGSKGTADGICGDHVIIAPPYTITEDELVFIVDTLKVAIDAVFKSIQELA
ncbi:unnamed protein product [Adineta steineri]|uniref:Aminotransferase n=3 Tax=Adineta steineri TaxID=433720 RepID=A0A813P235_9BILA|nr:unnamed protein product [Adineta steineri]